LTFCLIFLAARRPLPLHPYRNIRVGSTWYARFR
jgi:hypothetical protein